MFSTKRKYTNDAWQKHNAQKKIKELNEHIGGFKNWSMLNDDCKKKVVGYLDYMTRKSLEVCSRSDYETVNKTPLDLKFISIRNQQGVENHISVCMRENGGELSEINFCSNKKGTEIKWIKKRADGKRELRARVVKGKNFEKEAVRLVEKLMRECKYKVEEFGMNLTNYPIAKSEIEWLPKCRKVFLTFQSDEVLRSWLRKMPKQLEELRIDIPERCSVKIPHRFLNITQVSNAKSLIVPWYPFADKHLQSFNIKELTIESSGITDEGINSFLKLWANSKQSDFKDLELYFNRYMDKNKVLAELNARPWTNDFEEQEPTFCERFRTQNASRGTFYQLRNWINALNSLTILLDDDYVRIYASGRASVENEIKTTKYYCPFDKS
ncbi:unnamed protein product [Caenorhabditis sp. 36 PRJEB53466]|nr:unnamed protein product [Caenorhabditis sp. 36 PRJEB53466]